MTTTARAESGTRVPDPTFDSLNPATGEVVASFELMSAERVRAVVDAARPAALWWHELGFDGRKQRLLAWRSFLAKHIRELADVVHAENGKPDGDAAFEVGVAIEHLDWAAKHAPKVLGRSRVGAGLLAANHGASVSYQPFGVVGVLGPWNYPVHTPLGSISYALAAGNAVVFKPSEFTTAVGEWLVSSFAHVVPEHPVLSLVTGKGETGQALCRSGVDKLAFTGSTATGKKVMAACAESLTPVVIECGGKDAMIVAEDADVVAAADAAVWGGMSNAGQTCIGIERVYVMEPVYDQFLAEVTARAEGLRPGEDRTADMGPITMPAQLDVISRHIDDALARGARAVVGGPESVRAPYVWPVVLVDVPLDSAAEQEETFGPTVTINKVSSIDDAVARANGTPFGLGAAVYSAHHGPAIAQRIRAGMVSINSVITFAAVPSLPFGGVGDSGFGRIHGADGLREFAWPRAVTKLRFPGLINLQTFAKKPNAVKNLITVIQTRWG